MKEKLKAIETIMNSYDAFYIENKYGDGTHKEEFKILEEHFKEDDMGKRALNWIKHEYDCYYKDDNTEGVGTVFEYLKNKIRRDKK